MEALRAFFISMDFLILALATFRISTLIAEEDGPLNLISKLRYLAGVRKDENGYEYGINNFATGLICKWCNSIWIGIILTVIYMLSKDVLWVCIPLALSSVTMVLARWTDG